MSRTERTYIAIDLKSFYASAECVERGLDPLTTNLVVADLSRTEKTICLAVSPGLKSWGISGRARLFQVVQRVTDVNRERLRHAPGCRFREKSTDDTQIRSDPSLELDYIVAPPQMAHYMDFSTRIYQVYLKYVAPEDIVVYSIDEVFIDATAYLGARGMTAHDFAMTIIHDVLRTTGITATAGIAPNLFLCKVAMDVKAKHMPADRDGVRIAELDEDSFRREFWGHRPLTDFWRIGPGTAKRLEGCGMFTLGDVARCSEYNEDLLYKLFGVNAELLIDHAWGWEPCTIADIKAYKPESNSLSSGQVLQRPYEWDMARTVVQEMADSMALDLIKKQLVTDQITLAIGYDVDNLTDPDRMSAYTGEIKEDHYGRRVPKMVNGSANLPRQTASSRLITAAAMEIFDRITDKNLLVRRMYLGANHVVPEWELVPPEEPAQLDLFTDYEAEERKKAAEENRLDRELRRQRATVAIHSKYGKNALLKGTNFKEGATAIERNGQIGGHKA